MKIKNTKTVSCEKVYVTWQERFFSISGLKKDYFKSNKLTENTKFCLSMLSERKQRRAGGTNILKVYSDL